MKYLFINNALSGTGGARVILNLAAILIDFGHKVSIVVDRDDNIDYEIPDGVDVYLWGVDKVSPIPADRVGGTYSHERKKYRHVSLIKNIKQVLRPLKAKFVFIKEMLFNSRYEASMASFYSKNKFDVVVNSNVYIGLDRHIFLSRLFSDKYYVNFHNSPKEIFSRRDFFVRGSIGELFGRSKLLGVSQGIIDELNQYRELDGAPKTAIYNVFDFSLIKRRSEEEITGLLGDYIISVSSLTQRKRVERLIYSFEAISKGHPSLKLLILGDGELKSSLQNIVEECSLKDKVVFYGFCSNPYPLIARARLLMLASDSEGLPTVIIEALSLGIPVISTNCPTGPEEILAPWGNDYLISLHQSESAIVSELAEKANRVLESDYDREYVIKKSQLERFERDSVIAKWESLNV
ncbi:glycosyltransferase [Aeromonas caviae]